MDGIFAPANRLDEIAVEIRTTWLRIERDIPTTQRLLNEARDLCRARRVNFDRWCKSGKFGIHKTQIYNLLKGQSSSHVHPMDVLHGKTDKHFWLTPPAKKAEVYRVFNINYDACPYPRPPGFDSLTEEWGTNTYVNSLFDNLGPFVKKAIEEFKKGKLIVLVMPTNSMRLIQQLQKAGATQWGEMESVDWEATEDGLISPDPLLCVWLVLRPRAGEATHGFAGVEDPKLVLRPPTDGDVDEGEVRPASAGDVDVRRSMDDNVSTAHEFARRIVKHFPIRGRALDPCRGGGAFYDALSEPKFWCEIKEGRDFLDWTERVDWIVTNPGWSTEVYRAIAKHAFEIADNVVFLVRWHNATGTTARHYDWLDAGHGWRETIVVPWRDAGFLNTNGDEKHAEGFCLAVFWWQRGWTGPMTTTYW
jgi:hypothetical protein